YLRWRKLPSLAQASKLVPTISYSNSNSKPQASKLVPTISYSNSNSLAQASKLVPTNILLKLKLAGASFQACANKYPTQTQIPNSLFHVTLYVLNLASP